MGGLKTYDLLTSVPPMEQSGQGMTPVLATECGHVGWGQVVQGMPVRAAPSAPPLPTPSKGGPTGMDMGRLMQLIGTRTFSGAGHASARSAISARLTHRQGEGRLLEWTWAWCRCSKCGHAPVSTSSEMGVHESASGWQKSDVRYGYLEQRFFYKPRGEAKKHTSMPRGELGS
eukprot:1160857-Pelagomonas_calceolata.AAC.3